MARQLHRRSVLAAVGATALAGCLGGDDDETTTPGGEASTDTGSTPTEEAATPTATDVDGPPTVEMPLPLPLEPSELQEKAVSGGPPKDGIPSIDEPEFVDAGDAPDGLKPGDPVFGVVLNGEAKAYSQKILAQHEICNDSIGGTPVSVTYCPLTGTALGFFRGGTTFGVSGRLVNNNLIMYDRASETWWPQVLSTAIPGPWNEDPEIQSLQQFPVVWTTWQEWKTAHPDTKLLSRETGYARDYDRDPYGSYNPRAGYYELEQEPMFPALSPNDKIGADIPPKDVVIGARTTEASVAFEKDLLRDEKLVEGVLGETPVLGVYSEGLDTGYVYPNPEERSFEYGDGGVVDADGQRYDPAGLPLDQVLSLDAMWFAWKGFYPNSEVYV